MWDEGDNGNEMGNVDDRAEWKEFSNFPSNNKRSSVSRVACVWKYLSSYHKFPCSIDSSCLHVNIEAMLPTGDHYSVLHREYGLQLLLHWGLGEIMAGPRRADPQHLTQLFQR